MMKKNILLACLLALVLCSCETTKDNTSLAYFQNLKDVEGTVPTTQVDYKVRIHPDDELLINITSSVAEATAMYNAPINNMSTRGNTAITSQPRVMTYIVDKDGYINIPVIGKLNVKDKTTDDVADMVKAKVSENVKDPYVRVELCNFTINVLGEVRNPQRIGVGREHYSVLDALAQAGDLTEYGLRDRVLLIRTENGQTTYHRLNLMDASIYSSPYYYVKQNDVIYVEPSTVKVDNAKYNQNNAFKLSQLSVIVSAASVIASLVIALCVK